MDGWINNKIDPEQKQDKIHQKICMYLELLPLLEMPASPRQGAVLGDDVDDAHRSQTFPSYRGLEKQGNQTTQEPLLICSAF
jgi:hypothetical protein